MQSNQGQLQINDGTVLDPKVVKVMRAIRQVESGGAYDAVGDGGAAHGAFQYNEQTGPGWKNIARQYLGDENAPMDKANQNKATYYRIKEWKDQGRDPEEIAALWNGASKDPQTGRYVYNNPEYGEKFRAALMGEQQQLGGTYTAPPQPQPFTPATTTGFEQLQQQAGLEPDNYLGKLGQVATGVGTGIEQAWAPESQQNMGSSLLQTGGAIAGGLGGVVDASLSSVPFLGKVYEGATNLIGGAVGGALQSEPGQAAMQALGVDDWSDETKRNAEAVMNIASIFPLGKGLSLGVKGLSDVRTGVGAAIPETKIGPVTVGGVAEKAREELTGAASATQPSKRGLVSAQKQGKDPVGLILNNQAYMPEVKDLPDGRQAYDTQKALQKIEQDLEADELALQNLLNSTRSMAPGAKNALGKEPLAFNINDIAATTIKDVLGKAGRTGNYGALKTALTKYFDDYKQSMQGVEFVDLSELNAIKRDIRSAINFDAVDPTGTLAKQAKFDAGQSLMKQVEEAAKKAGVKGVRELNKNYGTRISAKNILEFLNERPITFGKRGTGGLIKSFSREVPFLEGAVDYISKKLGRTPLQRLQGRRPVGQTARRAGTQLATGLALSSQPTSEQ